VAKTTSPVVKTADFLDILREVSQRNAWCSDAEEYVETRLKLRLQPLGDDYCCPEHSSQLRFQPEPGQAESLDAATLAAELKRAKEQGLLDREDVTTLAALLPKDLRESVTPVPVVLTVSFTVSLAEYPDLEVKGASGLYVRRTLADRLWSGSVENLKIERA